MTEAELNKRDIYIESYGGGYIIANYSGVTKFCGISKNWRTQPIVSDPFLTKEDAIKEAS